MAVHTSAQRLFGIIQMTRAKKAEAHRLIKILEYLDERVYKIITCRIRVASIKADTYAGLIFHPINDIL